MRLWLTILLVGLSVPVSAQYVVAPNVPVIVVWDRSTDIVVGYRCYLDGVKVGGDIPPGTTTCLLPGVQSGAHVAGVTAFNDTGESQPSSMGFTASGSTAPPPTSGVPKPPTNLRISQ